MFKKLLTMFLVLIMMVAFIIPSAYAQARYGLKMSSAIETNTDLVVAAGSWIYGIKIFADESNSYMGLSDAATVSAATSANLFDDIGEATQYDTQVIWYPKPRYVTNGLSAQMSTGLGVVFYGPEPTK
jgi:hypothetical protein